MHTGPAHIVNVRVLSGDTMGKLIIRTAGDGSIYTRGTCPSAGAARRSTNIRCRPDMSNFGSWMEQCCCLAFYTTRGRHQKLIQMIGDINKIQGGFTQTLSETEKNLFRTSARLRTLQVKQDGNYCGRCTTIIPLPLKSA